MIHAYSLTCPSSEGTLPMTLEKKISEHQCKISQAETWSNLIHREQLVAHHGPKFSRSNEIVEILKEISVKQG